MLKNNDKIKDNFILKPETFGYFENIYDLNINICYDIIKLFDIKIWYYIILFDILIPQYSIGLIL